MLRIFLEYRSRTCIMDDWNWYDERENMVKSAKAETVAEDGASPASTETLDGKPGQAEEN